MKIDGSDLPKIQSSLLAALLMIANERKSALMASVAR